MCEKLANNTVTLVRHKSMLEMSHWVNVLVCGHLCNIQQETVGYPVRILLYIKLEN